MVLFQGTLCTDPTQVVNIEQYKQFLPLARGSLEIESEIQHDTVGIAHFS